MIFSGLLLFAAQALAGRVSFEPTVSCPQNGLAAQDITSFVDYFSFPASTFGSHSTDSPLLNSQPQLAKSALFEPLKLTAVFYSPVELSRKDSCSYSSPIKVSAPAYPITVDSSLDYKIDLSNAYESFSKLYPKESSSFHPQNENDMKFISQIVETYSVFQQSAKSPESQPFRINIHLTGAKYLTPKQTKLAASIIEDTFAKCVKMASKSFEKSQTFFTLISDKQFYDVESAVESIDAKVSSSQNKEDAKFVVQLSKRQFESYNPANYATFDQCMNATKNCTGQGFCAQKNSTKTPTFVCKCGRFKVVNGVTTKLPFKYAGEACQYEDISAEFHIIFWTTIGLLGAIL